MKLNRRSLLAGTAALGASACVPVDRSPLGRADATLRLIEAAGDGTLGVAILDTGSGLMLGHNSEQRFGHCSSFKCSLAAMVLALDEAGEIDAQRIVTWGRDEMVAYSPMTKDRVATGASLRELASFAQIHSDNTAANVLLRELGGPGALTAFWRGIGDEYSRLDRFEPELNLVPITEYRDTATPEAMALTLSKLLYGEALPTGPQAVLREWMVETKTGANRVRAGLPEEWLAGDKTGTSLWPGINSLYVDIGFVQPPNLPPLTYAAYFRASESHSRIEPASEQVLARLGDVIKDFARRDERRFGIF